MDFYRISLREPKKKGEPEELYPDFKIGRSKDLMVQGRQFYAIWDEALGLWSRDEYDVQRLVDEDLERYSKYLTSKTGLEYSVKYLSSAGTGGWYQFKKYVQNLSDNSHPLDQELTFANTEVKKGDHVSIRLPYSLEPGDFSAWDELVGTLYPLTEREKIEWIIGSIVAGDAKKIQKFAVFYGAPGTGKGTILDIVKKLFIGYTAGFDAKALGANGSNFATDAFRSNPLVAIQPDGNLSKIEDNATLNSITAHEEIRMNEKFKPSYDSKVNAFLMIGSNSAVKITDAKSGIIRRLIDIHPSGVLIEENHYRTLMSRTDFELGAIAQHCLEVYRSLGRNHYSGYRPLEMMLQTDVFFNFIEANFDVFKIQDGTTLSQAYALYKEYCDSTGIDKVQPQYLFREELRNYFDEFKDRANVDGHVVRSVYVGFNANKFKTSVKGKAAFSLVIEETESLLDEMFAQQPAQYARANGNPEKFWTYAKKLINGKLQVPEPSQVVSTILSDIDTKRLHFVKIPEQHIVIDFDLKGEDGEKSLERNLEAASVWPPTYAELSKGGGGVHLHYTYDGDVTELAPLFSEGIEVKTLLGDSSLRRRLSKCNNIPVAVISTGLPIKEKKPVIEERQIKSEKGLRDLIGRCLAKEFNPGTKSSVDFIKKVLDDAYESGMSYDVTDMRSTIVAFAAGASNQAIIALRVVQQMKFKGEGAPEEKVVGPDDVPESQEVRDEARARDDKPVVLFDVEVYKNLFVVCWKFRGSPEVVRMVNPTAKEIEPLLRLKLVGFNNRRYDNHILWAAYMGYNNLSLYNLSQAIISNNRNALFGEAYNLSYADIYEYAATKKSLKMWMIELSINKVEMDHPWDEEVPPELVDKIVEYCVNDVEGTEAVFDHLWADFKARQILMELSGLQANDTTQRHTAQILFGNDRNANQKFIHTDLSVMFPGYTFDMGKSSYRGEDPSEGGYVYEEIGMFENVGVWDVASMHPTSIINMNYFGPYTDRFKDLVDARIAIKNERFEEAREMLGGRLKPYLEDEGSAEALSYALKIVINIVYGMTSARFENPFKNHENKDNVVAKRGALFMIDLKRYMQEKGYTVVHIKTDSIKIANVTPENHGQINTLITEFGKQYGYDFDYEALYDRFCLIDKAQYIAHYGWAAKARKIGTWEAVGAKFQHPYVFKTLFDKQPIEFDDLVETKQVNKGTMYLDFELDTPQPVIEHMKFIGRFGQFVPVTEGSANGYIGGAALYRVAEDPKDASKQKCYAVSGTKGYLWMEADRARLRLDEDNLAIDMGYYDALADDAVKTINKFGDFEVFTR